VRAACRSFDGEFTRSAMDPDAGLDTHTPTGRVEDDAPITRMQWGDRRGTDGATICSSGRPTARWRGPVRLGTDRPE
jgi:hypothetical protein